MSEHFVPEVRHLTFERVLGERAEQYGERMFLHYLPDDRRFSYVEIDRISNRLANGLVAHGIGKGTHVAVLMENSPEHMFAYFALAKIGAVFVPLNTASLGEHLKYFVAHSDAEAFVIDEALLPRVEDIRESVPRVQRLFVLPSNGIRLTTANAAVSGVVSYRDLEMFPDSRTTIETKYSDLCSLMYTSGTTGPSKANMFTQAHTLAFGLEPLVANEFGANDVYYNCLPLFHAAGWNMFTLAPLLLGGAVAVTGRFSVSNFWRDVRRSGATFVNSAGVAQFLLNTPPSPEDRDHKVRCFAAAPQPPDPIAFEERFGVRLSSGYGLSDYCHALAFTWSDDRSKLGSCGRPTPGVEVRFVDEDDFDVPPGSPGEILLRTRQPWTSTTGYYKMPEATVAATRNQWFHTGDRGYMDKDGFVFFLDRKKDAIRRRGENISAFEVEMAVNAHPAVLECAAYAVPAEGTEDEVAVSIMLKPGMQANMTDIAFHCERAMPKFMVPRFIEIREEFPRTMTFKIQKVKLREEAKSNPNKLWDRLAKAS